MREIEAELDRLGKRHEFHSYREAGHGFFATDRPSYRSEAAAEGWRRIWDFLERSLRPAGQGGSLEKD